MVPFLDAILGFVGAHPFIALTILAALVFDFVNGFHDSANAIATVIATKVLTPLQAVMMAGFFNFVGPFIFSLAVATTIGKGILNADGIEPGVLTGLVFAALIGATVWDIVTWYTGLPTSSSHAIVGGLVGAGLAAAGPGGIVLPTWPEWLDIGYYAALGIAGGLGLSIVALILSRARLPRGAHALMMLGGAGLAAYLVLSSRGPPDFSLGRHVLEWFLSAFVMVFMGAVAGSILWISTQRPMSPVLAPGFAGLGAAVALIVATLRGDLVMGGVTKTLLFMVVSPFLGFFAGFLLATVVSWVGERRSPAKVSTWSKRLQLFSSSFYALTHGTNDAQKTMGVIGVLLIAAGALTVTEGSKTLEIPTWVIVASALAMGLGTIFGGWRIVQTMASRITHLTPALGFAAETGGGVVLVAMAQAGIPVSTTHAISSSIMGVGATRRTSAVRWAVGRRIVGAWILTIPASAVVAYVSYVVLKLFL